MRNLIIIISLIISFNSFSQELNYKKVDSETYNLYQNGKWEALVAFGKNAEKAGFNYYYFNLRMGIAYFNLAQYLSAEKYLKKAIDNNNTDLPKEYLFKVYLWSGEKMLAEQVYDQLSETNKAKMNYQKTFLEMLYAEGGVKVSNLDVVANINYGFVALKHRLGDKLNVTHSFNIYTQQTSTQKLTHNQYNFVGSIPVNQSTISIGVILASSNINGVIGTGTGVLSNINSTTNNFYLDYTKRFGRLKMGLNISYTSQSSSLTSNKDNSFTPSVTMSYSPEIFEDKANFGADVYYISSGNITNVTVKPFMLINFSTKIWLWTDYLTVGNYLFADKTSGILFDTPFIATKRFTGTLNTLISPKVIAKLTFTSESLDDNLNSISYKFNSVFLGIQYKF
jgi:tetratricopeptide (TPR) repeat protein